MTDETPLDRAHAAMQADPADDAARLRFYERLAEAEVFLLLEKEAQADGVSPRLFTVDNVQYALVFDSEERLAEFAGAAVHHVALSGRALVGMLAGEDIGVGINLDVAPSAFLMGPDAVDWLAVALAGAVKETAERPLEIAPPFDVAPALLSGLGDKLALAAGLARAAWLAQVSYAGGSRATLLAIVGVQDGAREALRQAVSEAVVFCAGERSQLDLVFLDEADPVVARLERVGLRISIPEPEQPAVFQPEAPGMDPDKPPKLR